MIARFVIGLSQTVLRYIKAIAIAIAIGCGVTIAGTLQEPPPVFDKTVPIGRRDAFVLGTHIDSDSVNVATILSRFDDASEMRFGNTFREMRLSAWESYSNRRVWWLPGYNYPTQHIIFAQFRGAKLKPMTMMLPVYLYQDNLDGSLFPHLKLPDSRSSNDIIVQDFEVWNERWATYQDAYGHGNVFFPMTHQSSGGVDNDGYIWTDSSRWAIDPPEQPNSILIALNYYKWLFPSEWRSRTGLGDVVDLRSTKLEVYLRGRDLQLGSAYVTFWLLCDGARWHLSEPHLSIINGKWTLNSISLPGNQEMWERSWSRGGKASSLCLDRVESFGMALRGFPRGQKVLGVFEMDRFRLHRTPNLQVK